MRVSRFQSCGFVSRATWLGARRRVIEVPRRECNPFASSRLQLGASETRIDVASFEVGGFAWARNILAGGYLETWVCATLFAAQADLKWAASR